MTQKGNPKAVFIVEDDEGMREAIEELLGVAGFRTVGYGSAEAYLNEAVRENPLCVISKGPRSARFLISMVPGMKCRYASATRASASSSTRASRTPISRGARRTSRCGSIDRAAVT